MPEGLPSGRPFGGHFDGPGGGGLVGLGFETESPVQGTIRAPRQRETSNESDEGGGNNSYGSMGTARGMMSPGGQVYAEPGSIESRYRHPLMSDNHNRPFRRYQSNQSDALNADDEFDEFGGPPSASSSYANLATNFGRPASIDMAALSASTSQEGIHPIDIMLSPPPGADARGFTPGTGQQPLGASRSRTFPAPLLLKSDRPFGGVHPPSPVIGATAPLSIGRNLSASAGSSPAPSVAPSPMQTAPLTRSQFSQLSNSTNSRVVQEPTPAVIGHRPRGSSTSSYAHGSVLPYSHSPHPSFSSAANSSPSIGHGAFSASTSSLQSAFAPSAARSTTSNGSSSTVTASSKQPITPQALHLHVLSLRSQPMSASQSHGAPARSGTPLSADPNHQRIRSVGSNVSEAEGDDLGQSRPAVQTLTLVDLSHKRIDQVPIDVVVELGDEVQKLALGYNMLRELPTFFTMLRSLRYLNVRVNVFTTFPQVLCEMPSLEILDFSRNKVKRLPSAPGTLVNLRVFSVAKNKIKRLPTWFAHMSRLQVLKIEGNPIEWPPKDVAAFPSAAGAERPMPTKGEEEAEMNRYVSSLTTWIRNNATRENARDPMSHSSRRPSILPDQTDDDERSSPHHHDEPTRQNGMTRTESGRTAVSPTTPVSAAFPQQHLPDLDLPQHSRNNSATGTHTSQPEERRALRPKKSLPDMRQNHSDILAERRNLSGAQDEPRAMPTSQIGPIGLASRLKNRPEMFHANSARAALPGQSSAVPTVPARSQSARPGALPGSGPNATGARPTRSPSPGPVRQAVNFDPPPRPRNKVAASGGNEADRNSGAYFRRLSMLPASTISKAVPANLLQFAHAIRGILFAFSRIYKGIKEFALNASNEQMPRSMARLMNDADGSTNTLINALDRFDSLSRRGSPSPDIVRDMFVSCRENVAIFQQLMAALKSQLKSLTTAVDLRDTRTLLLDIYGAMAEIIHSWNAVGPLMAEMNNPNQVATLILQPPTPSPSMSSTSRVPQGGQQLGRAKSKTRRHAGSFSVEDVQIGAVLGPDSQTAQEPGSMGPLPSPMDAPTLKPRQAKGSRGPPPSMIAMPPTYSSRDPQGDGPKTPMAPPEQLYGEPTGPWSNGGGSTANSPVMSSNGFTPVRSSSFSRPSGPSGPLDSSFSGTVRPGGSIGNTNTPIANFDQTFLSIVDNTTRHGSDVYNMMLDLLDLADHPDAQGRVLLPMRVKELQDMCFLGNETTNKLRSALARLMGLGGERGPRYDQDAQKLIGSVDDFNRGAARFIKTIKAISSMHEYGFSNEMVSAVSTLVNASGQLARCLRPGTAGGMRAGGMGGSGGGGGGTGLGFGAVAGQQGMMVGGPGRI